ncbi:MULTISPECIES: metallophosphoesterase [Methanobrevibacter]|uniref:metallophosphoesterase n=1 Tax=Methanobrevibacter TaxID=2172 RepID=UPI0015C0D76F|nr:MULTISPECIES: metallophosphoesterase [Methanobrevibacter]MBS7257596.1 metallophosphoesterase [Methanobrevibacter sp.]MCI7428479.1 metallophosphoesterase [Methanobrevibacter sp.]MDD6776440.1 metallophosphoesterase [Methanobacteriaceae archaeon]MDY3097227.1 metallophosphoesterase [Methanobrevibacter sp.]
MTQKDIDTPSAMRIRQGIQDAITYSLPDKKFDSSKIEVVEIDITIDNLGWNFNNLRILNLTDIHLGQWINPEYLDKLIDYVNTLNVDLVTLTGDYFSYVTKGYEQSLQDSFKKIESKYGKFGVLGNHDHWMGSKKVRDIFTNSNVIDLSNDVYTLEKDGEFLNICGVDSCTVCADNLDKVLAKMKKDTPSILLAHEPDFAKQSSQTNRFDLQISGHSHGGQFIIPKFETTPFRGPNSRKYPVGIYEVGNMIQYTSKGLGTNSFRLRVNCKPEITIITLKTNKKQEILIK